MSYTLRIENISHMNFLSKAIIETEKIGSDKMGFAKVSNLTQS